MNVQEFAELSAGHAVGALSSDDRRLFDAALREHPEWQSIVDADLETASSLGDSVAPVAPPLAARSQILGLIRSSAAAEASAGDAAVTDASGFAPAAAAPVTDSPMYAAMIADSEKAADPDDTVAVGTLRADADDDATVATRVPSASDTSGDAPSAEELPPVPATAAPEEAALRAAAPPTEIVQAVQRRNWTRGIFALAASIALLVGIGWGVGAITDSLRTPPAVSTLAQIQSAPDAQVASGELAEGGEATLHWSETVGEAVIVASGLPEIESDRTFELWFVRDGTAIPAGTFDSSSGDATALLSGEMHVGDTIAVTVEQQGGSPDGTPTTDPILAIASAAA